MVDPGRAIWDGVNVLLAQGLFPVDSEKKKSPELYYLCSNCCLYLLLPQEEPVFASVNQKPAIHPTLQPLVPCSEDNR